MKVVLLRDVPKLGRKGEVKEVADGFAYNNLIPRKLVAPATKENVQKAEAAQAALVHARETKVQLIDTIATRSLETPPTIVALANAEGHLFKGVRAADVVAAIRVELGGAIDEKDVVLPQPLKEAGEHQITIRAGDHERVCRVIIEAKQS